MKLAALLVAGAALALPNLAEADCGVPTWIGTPDGARIPPRGSLYVYNELLRHDLMELAPGKGAITKRTKVGDAVMRLDYESSASELEIVLNDWDKPVYAIDPGWRAPQALPRVIQFWRHASEWTCSSADSLMIQIDQPSAAYRAIWKADGKPAREWIIPARTAEDNRNVLELGKIDCGGMTIDPGELAAGGQLTLFAIRYDGTEVAVTGLPPRISSKDLLTSDAGVSQAIGYASGEEPIKPAPQPLFTIEEHHEDVAWQVFLCVLGVLAPLLYVRFSNRTLKSIT